MPPPTQIAPEVSGSSGAVSWFRTVLKNIRERTVTVGPGLRASYGTDGTLIEIRSEQQAAGTAGSTLSIMRVKTIFDDVLLCYPETQDPFNLNHVLDQNAWAYVFKPYELRKTPFHSKTWNNVTYTYTTSQTRQARAPLLGTGYETQNVFPPYLAGIAGVYSGNDTVLGTQIIAASLVAGITFAFTPPDTYPGAGTPQSINYVEIAPARVWAEFSYTP